MVTWPLDADVMETAPSDTRYDLPSLSCVRDPERPYTDPDTKTSPPKTVEPVTVVFLLPTDPETKKKTSEPIDVA